MPLAMVVEDAPAVAVRRAEKHAVVDMIARRLFDEVEVDELFAAGVYRTPIE